MIRKGLLAIFLAMVVFFSAAAAADGENQFSAPPVSGEMEIPFPEGKDGNDLARGFIDQRLPSKPKTILRATRPSGLKLEGPNLALYRLLIRDITDVADGKRTSTIFTYTPAEVYGKDTFLPSDYGKPYFYQEDYDAIFALWQELDFNAVIECVIADCPYELYWRYLSSGFEGCGISGSSECIELTGSIIVRIVVSSDYVYVDPDTNEPDWFQVDPKYGTAVNAAKVNAQRIWAEHAGEDDLTRLTSYRDEICNLTDYNWDAVNQGWPYGNPWQLIWVFDGDPSTQVVCEGYSKAFEYLNSLSPGPVEVISVNGFMDGTGDDDRHMWNIVTIDGHNYLADITNCDGSNRDVLFLRGYEDGNLAQGYTILGGSTPHLYTYDSNPQAEADLTLPPFSYAEWREAVSTAPTVTLSSTKTFPGYAIVISAEQGIVPMDALQIGNSRIPLTDGVALFAPAESGEIAVSAVYGETASPAGDPIAITVAPLPETALVPPAGCRIEEESFLGTGAAMALLEDCTVSENAFDGLQLAVLQGNTAYEDNSFNEDAVLAVEDADFSLAYPFVVPVQDAGAAE